MWINFNERKESSSEKPTTGSLIREIPSQALLIGHVLKAKVIRLTSQRKSGRSLEACPMGRVNSVNSTSSQTILQIGLINESLDSYTVHLDVSENETRLTVTTVQDNTRLARTNSLQLRIGTKAWFVLWFPCSYTSPYTRSTWTCSIKRFLVPGFLYEQGKPWNCGRVLLLQHRHQWRWSHCEEPPASEDHSPQTHPVELWSSAVA